MGCPNGDVRYREILRDVMTDVGELPGRDRAFR